MPAFLPSFLPSFLSLSFRSQMEFPDLPSSSNLLSVGVGLVGIAAVCLSVKGAIGYLKPHLDLSFRHLQVANGTLFAQTEVNTQMLTCLGKEVGKIQDTISLLIDHLEDVKAGLEEAGGPSLSRSASSASTSPNFKQASGAGGERFPPAAAAASEEKSENKEEEEDEAEHEARARRTARSSSLVIPCDNSERILRQLKAVQQKMNEGIQKELEALEKEKEKEKAPRSSSSHPKSHPVTRTTSTGHLFANLAQTFASKTASMFSSSAPTSPISTTPPVLSKSADVPTPQEPSCKPAPLLENPYAHQQLALVVPKRSHAIPDLLGLGKYLTGFVSTGLFSVFQAIII